MRRRPALALALALALLLARCGGEAAFAAGIALPALPNHPTAASSDLVPIQPAAGSQLYNISLAQLAAYFGAGGSTTPGGSAGQLQYNNAGAFGGFTLAGDCALSEPVITCTKTNGSPFAASATVNALDASNISSGTLAAGRIAGIYAGITGVGTLTAGSIPASLITGLTTGATIDGTPTAGHCVEWYSATQLEDAGGACASGSYAAIQPTPTAGHCVEWYSATTVEDAGAACGAGGITALTGAVTGAGAGSVVTTATDPFPIGAADIWTAAGVPTSSGYPNGTLYLRTDYGDAYRYRASGSSTPALVQKGVNLGNGAGGLSLVLGTTPTLGDVLVAVGFSGYSAGLPSLSAGWIAISQTASAGSNYPSRISAYRYVQAGDGATMSPFGGDIRMLAVFEVSGLSTSWAASLQNEQTIAATAGNSTTLSASTTNTNTLALGVYGADQSLQDFTSSGSISGLTGTLASAVGNGSSGAWNTAVVATSEFFASSSSAISIGYVYGGSGVNGGFAGDLLLLQGAAPENAGWQPISVLRTIQAQGTTVELDPSLINFAGGLAATSNTAGSVTVVAAPGASTVSTLPASPAVGQAGFVTDASACTFNSSVSGGGSTKCPVVWTGSAWVAG